MSFMAIDESWVENDPLQRNLARVVRDQVQALKKLADDVHSKVVGLEGNEMTRVLRTEMAIREKIANIAMRAMKEDVGSAILESEEHLEA